jgi:glycosyltransferase involved in cell wall biosynthesis
MNLLNENPLVSVCIPCYNSANTIADTLNSIISQSYKNIEIIICDNCSTDDTVLIINSIPDYRIRFFINESNLGMVGNFERVLSYVKGEFVKVMCADDLITVDCIAKQLKPFIENSDRNIALVSCEKWIINSTGKKLFQKKIPGTEGYLNGRLWIKKTMMAGSNLIGEPGAILFKQEIAQKTSGFQVEKELSYVVDLNFWFKLLLLGDLFMIKEPLFSFRISKSSESAGYGKNQAISFNRLIDKYIQNNSLHLTRFQIWKGKTFSKLLSFVRNLIFKFAN